MEIADRKPVSKRAVDMPPAQTAATAGSMQHCAPDDDASSNGLTPEAAARRAQASKQLLTSFGEVLSVMMRSPRYRELKLSDVESLVVPAVMTGQFVVAQAQSKTNGFVSPVGVVLWASLSDEIDARISANPEKDLDLAMGDWKSGNQPWVMAVVGDTRITGPLLQRLQRNLFQSRPLKMRVRLADGTFKITRFNPEEEVSADP